MDHHLPNPDHDLHDWNHNLELKDDHRREDRRDRTEDRKQMLDGVCHD